MPDPNYVHHDGVTFLLPAKCANTSLKQAILRQRGEPVDTGRAGWFVRIHNAERLPYRERRGVDHDRHLVVGAVRDPVERVVSCWRDKVANVGRLEFRRPGRVEPRMPWPAFCAAVAETPDEGADQHFRSLTADLIVRNRRPHLLLRVHCLAEDWRALEQRQGWDHLGVPHLHRSGVRAPRPEVTPAQVAALQERYAEDYTQFGTAMENRRAA